MEIYVFYYFNIYKGLYSKDSKCLWATNTHTQNPCAPYHLTV